MKIYLFVLILAFLLSHPVYATSIIMPLSERILLSHHYIVAIKKLSALEN